MGKHRKVFEHILSQESDANVGFAELRGLLVRLGFEERVRGSHHIFSMDGIEEILNIQPRGANAKSYQVRQFRDIIMCYNLNMED